MSFLKLIRKLFGGDKPKAHGDDSPRIGDIYYFKNVSDSSPSYVFSVRGIDNDTIILYSNWGSIHEVTRKELRRDYIKASSNDSSSNFLI